MPGPGTTWAGTCASGPLRRRARLPQPGHRAEAEIAEAYNNRAATYASMSGSMTPSRLRRGDRDEADFAAPTTTAGTSTSMRGVPEKALDDFDQAIGLKPDFAMAYYNRGEAQRQSRPISGRAPAISTGRSSLMPELRRSLPQPGRRLLLPEGIRAGLGGREDVRAVGRRADAGFPKALMQASGRTE